MSDQLTIASMIVYYDDDTTDEFDNIVGLDFLEKQGASFLNIVTNDKQSHMINTAYIKKYTSQLEQLH